MGLKNSSVVVFFFFFSFIAFPFYRSWLRVNRTAQLIITQEVQEKPQKKIIITVLFFWLLAQLVQKFSTACLRTSLVFGMKDKTC